MIDLDSPVSLNDIVRAARVRDRCKQIRVYIGEYRMSIRECADNMQISKSSVHLYIHTYIKSYYLEDYDVICEVLRYNQRFRRKPRKHWR